MVTSSAAETTLIMKRSFAAPRQKVFDAWTNPEFLKQWFAAGDEYFTPLAEVDLRVGGTFRVAMEHKEKKIRHTAFGTYREVKAPERIVFTWAWEENKEEETLITVQFHEVGQTTEMIFKHEAFVTPESRNQHEHGWTACFARLAESIA
ncbi:MAG: SRPBCC domain-containing protein [bacterium]